MEHTEEKKGLLSRIGGFGKAVKDKTAEFVHNHPITTGFILGVIVTKGTEVVLESISNQEVTDDTVLDVVEDENGELVVVEVDTTEVTE